MSSIQASIVIFFCIFAGALIGMWLRSVLPPQHLSDETKDLVKLGAGLIGTMAALLLGLLVASAKSSYDARRTELTQIAANTILLDRALAHYGPTTAEARGTLKIAIARMIDQVGRKTVRIPRRLLQRRSRSESYLTKCRNWDPAPSPARSSRKPSLSS